MAGQQPGQLREAELPEYTFSGPFGGVQSEVPLDKIGLTGFADAQNVLFRKSSIQIAPLFAPVSLPISGTALVVGMADFFNVNGTRRFVAWTSDGKMWFWSGAWTQVTGTLLTGTAQQFISWDVVGYKLYFSQQADKVQVWDGITAGYTAANAAAVPAKYLCEFDFHLLAANTIEAGPAPAPNRIHWTGIGDGTDWSSFSSGQTDLFNGFGPINGLSRVYQSGYAFQQQGITQINLTGIGTAPFQFVPLGSRAKGSITPWSLASFGDLMSCYVGKDDVYLFDGTESQGIGSRPIDGNRKLGARARILADINNSNLQTIFGVIGTSNYGVDFESYWLFIPSLNKVWIYHFDEGSWSQMYFFPGTIVGPAGVFSNLVIPRIKDLIGQIFQQSWTPATLTGANPLDSLGISDGNNFTVSTLQPNQPSPLVLVSSPFINITSTGTYLRSGSLCYEDTRHNHTTKKIRVVFTDLGQNQFWMILTNEKGQRELHTQVYGNGSGGPLSIIVNTALPGRFFTWEFATLPGVNFALSEISFVYDVGGEIQGGSR